MPNGSRVPVGRSPAANMPTDRIELVGDRHRGPRHRPLTQLLSRRRQPRLDADGQILIRDRLPDRLGLTFAARVDAAHRALQLGELAHHVGREIGLREPARLARRAASTQVRAPIADPRSRPRAAPGAAPSRDSCRAACGTAACQAIELRFERRLLIRVPEELRVAQPRGQHALRVHADRARVVGLDVRDREERRHQLARCRPPPGNSADDESSWSSALPRAA